MSKPKFNRQYLRNVLPESREPVVLGIQDNLVATADDGEDCPCCGQRVQVYRRALSAKMAHFLILFAQLHTPETAWQPISVVPGVRGGDYAKLRFWKLIEQRPLDPGESTRSGTSGQWRLTTVGWKYVLRKAALPSHVFVYDNNYLGPAGPHQTIDVALGTKFDYEALTGCWRRGS